jgi:hypothetical protein
VDETRLAIAVAYASGRHVLLPWDIYIHDGPRWYGSIDDYRDLVDFIADHPMLFDGYRSHSDLTFLLPLERADNEESIVALAKELQRHGILYNYSVCGYDRNGFVLVPVQEEDFKPETPVWRIGEEDDFAPAVRPVLERMVSRGTTRYHGQLCSRLFGLTGRVITQVQAQHDLDQEDAASEDSGLSGPADDSIESLRARLAREAVERIRASGTESAYRVSDPSQVVVLPRINDTEGKPVIVHIVNAGPGLSGEQVWLNSTLFGGREPATVFVHRPGLDRLEAGLEKRDGGWSIQLPEMREWAVLEIGTR